MFKHSRFCLKQQEIMQKTLQTQQYEQTFITTTLHPSYMERHERALTTFLVSQTDRRYLHNRNFKDIYISSNCHCICKLLAINRTRPQYIWHTPRFVWKHPPIEAAFWPNKLVPKTPQICWTNERHWHCSWTLHQWTLVPVHQSEFIRHQWIRLHGKSRFRAHFLHESQQVALITSKCLWAQPSQK